MQLRPGPGSRVGQRGVEVIGVARDTGLDDWRRGSAANRTVYLPTTAHDAGNAVLLRVKGDVDAAKRAIEASLTARDPASIERIHKLSELASGQVYPFRAAYWVSLAIGTLALILTLIGIYGVLSCLVTERSKEIGIRMALGATTSGVTRLVLHQAVRLAAIGLTAGTLLAFGVSRFFASILVMMNTFDRVAYAGGILAVLAACLAASYIPAVRAARIDPVSSLRRE